MCGLVYTDKPSCPQRLPDSWVKYPNSHVYKGIATSDSDLDSCLASCVRNSSCTRLDWSPRASVGQRCWLHGHWSNSEPRRPNNGVTHYELRRTAVANWVKYPDMHVRRGIASGAADQAGCQDVCLNNASCTRIDWAPAASDGQRCWVHGPWSSSESRRSYQGVMHFELYRGSDGFCGEQHLHNIITISVTNALMRHQHGCGRVRLLASITRMHFLVNGKWGSFLTRKFFVA